MPPKKAENWRKSFKEEEALTFNLKVPKIILEKSTYTALTGDNENRIRIYLFVSSIWKSKSRQNISSKKQFRKHKVKAV